MRAARKPRPVPWEPNHNYDPVTDAIAAEPRATDCAAAIVWAGHCAGWPLRCHCVQAGLNPSLVLELPDRSMC